MNSESIGSASLGMAIYWDWQNVHASQKQIQWLMSFASARANICCKNIYADWRRESDELSYFLYYIGFDCLNVPTFNHEKNRADYKLIQDCETQVLTNPAINTVLLVSGDGDFKAMVNRLKSNGKTAIVVARCRQHASVQLIKAASEFYLLKEIEASFALPVAA